MSDGVTLPPSDDDWFSFAPDMTADDLDAVIGKALETPGKGPDYTHFVVIRDGERHGSGFEQRAFHLVLGAGVKLPAGSMRVQREWRASGMVDGNNEQLQTNGLAIVVEAGAPRPYPQATHDAVHTFCRALARRVPIHPDCIVAMQEAPYTDAHEADADERALAASARREVPFPPIDGRLTIQAAGGPIEVGFQRRTGNGIQVGMMLRRSFDRKNQGMLFEYPHHGARSFWMKNCRIAIDLAYVKKGKIRQLITMQPQWGQPHSVLRYHPSNSAVRFALEMPAGWFAKNGVNVGDRVVFE